MLNDITILISACCSQTMPGGLTCYRDNGERRVRIVGVDMINEPTARNMLDAFYQVPEATAPGYLDIILNICKKEKVDIFFPGISAEVSALIEYRKKFEAEGILVSMSNAESIQIGNNKLKTYQTLQNAGIPVPNFYEINSVEDFIRGCEFLGYPDHPVCLKAVNGSGSRGVRIIDNKKSRYEIFIHNKPNTLFTSYEDMLSVLESADSLEPMMLMPYLPGNEYTIDLLSENGRVLYMVGRDNVQSSMSIAQESIIMKNDIAYEIAEKVTSFLHYDGNLGIDFMKNANGVPVLTDINPRITATIVLAAAGGVNLPYLRIKQLLGEDLPELTVAYGTKIKRYYMEVFCDKEGNQIRLNPGII